MATLKCGSQSYLICQIIYYAILHLQCKYQEKRYKNCYHFLSSVQVLLDKYPYSVSQRYCVTFLGLFPKILFAIVTITITSSTLKSVLKRKAFFQE